MVKNAAAELAKVEAAKNQMEKSLNNSDGASREDLNAIEQVDGLFKNNLRVKIR